MFSFRFCGVLCIFQSSPLYANPLLKGIRMYYFTKMRLYHDYHKVFFVVRENEIISFPPVQIFLPLCDNIPTYFRKIFFLACQYSDLQKQVLSWLYMFRFKTNWYCLGTTCSTAPTRNQKIQCIFKGRCLDVEGQISSFINFPCLLPQCLFPQLLCGQFLPDANQMLLKLIIGSTRMINSFILGSFCFFLQQMCVRVLKLKSSFLIYVHPELYLVLVEVFLSFICKIFLCFFNQLKLQS